jgi:hypothetical protein
MEDLPLHIGLMQLLSLPELRCTPVLSLPTEEAARLLRARARRDEWHALVHIHAEDECSRMLRRLPVHKAVAVFRLPSLLSPQVLEELLSAEAPVVLSESECFIGSASAYAEWFGAGSIDGNLTTKFLQVISSLSPKDLPSVSASRATTDVQQSCHPAINMHPCGGSVELPDIGQGDELVVTALLEDSKVIARQRLDVCEPDQPIRIRVPAILTTTTPQKIRIDCDKHEITEFGEPLQFHVEPSEIRPWMISAFLNRGGAGNPVIRAFAEGVGCRIAYAEDEPEILADIPVVWGVLRDSDRIIAQAKSQGLYFFYVDHAYFNRGHGRTYRITRNGYEAGPIRVVPGDRISALQVRLEPWRKSGSEIIVCPPTDYFMQAHGCIDWLDTTLATLRSVTDRPIKVRRKPKPGEEVVPLEQALQNAHALVTHSSNVAIEAVCFGTPAFVAPASAAAPVARTNILEIENPIYPDRASWLAHLAYNQFSFEEIANGRAWRMLLEFEQRDLA